MSQAPSMRDPADLREMSLGQLLEALGARTPVPGGGAAACMTAALAAALAQMVAAYSQGKKSLAAHDDLHAAALAALRELRERALALAQADAAAYARLNEVQKAVRTDPARTRDLPDAVEAAIDAPHQSLHVAMELLRLLERLVGTTSHALGSDLAIATVLAEAAARAAAWNVRINLPLLDDPALRAQFQSTLAQTLEQAHNICAQIERSCAQGA